MRGRKKETGGPEAPKGFAVAGGFKLPPLVVFVIIFVILLLGVIVALMPTVNYAPTPRVVLYLLIAILPAILFADAASSKFRMKLLHFGATAAGSAAFVLIGLTTLTYLSKPSVQIAVYNVYDQNDNPIYGLDRPGAVEIPVTSSGLAVTKYVDKNSIVLIFPEQVGKCELRIRPVSIQKAYVGEVTYSGTRQDKLILGKHLRIKEK